MRSSIRNSWLAGIVITYIGLMLMACDSNRPRLMLVSNIPNNCRCHPNLTALLGLGNELRRISSRAIGLIPPPPCPPSLTSMDSSLSGVEILSAPRDSVVYTLSAGAEHYEILTRISRDQENPAIINYQIRLTPMTP
jgi:hypothetical protein